MSYSQYDRGEGSKGTVEETGDNQQVCRCGATVVVKIVHRDDVDTPGYDKQNNQG